MARGHVQDGKMQTPQEIPVTIAKVNNDETVNVNAETQGPPNWTIDKFTVAQDYGEWIRPPNVVGTKGVLTSAASYYTGGMTNLGGGTANYRDRANMTTMLFRPVSNTKFATNNNRNFNATLISGPQGAVINDAKNITNITVNGSIITISASSGSVQIELTASAIYVNPGSGNVYLGAGSGGSFANVETTSGPSPNVFCTT